MGDVWGVLSFLNVFSSLVTLSYGEAGALGATAGPWYEKKMHNGMVEMMPDLTLEVMKDKMHQLRSTFLWQLKKQL